jgi:hypothetical protein
MKICPKCLSVYPMVYYNFVKKDGTELVHDCTPEGKKLVKRILKEASQR